MHAHSHIHVHAHTLKPMHTAHMCTHMHAHVYTLIFDTSMSDGMNKDLTLVRKEKTWVLKNRLSVWPLQLLQLHKRTSSHCSRHVAPLKIPEWAEHPPSSNFWTHWCLWPPWAPPLSLSATLFAELDPPHSPGLSSNVCP